MWIWNGVVLAIALAVPAIFAADDMAKKLNEVLMQGPSQKHWQIKAEEVAAMLKEKKGDFLIVDTRPNPQEYKEGHIPGSIYIAYNEILKPENLKKLPKDKKVILV